METRLDEMGTSPEQSGHTGARYGIVLLLIALVVGGSVLMFGSCGDRMNASDANLERTEK